MRWNDVKIFGIMYTTLATLLLVSLPFCSKSNGRKVQSVSISLQERSISGVVTNQGGDPLAGVSVILVGEGLQGLGTVTDIDGRYKIYPVPEGLSALRFSFLGFATQEIPVAGSTIVPVSGSTVINVVLKEEASKLDEVVLIGYGNRKRKNISAAISSIKKDKLQEVTGSAATFEQNLHGLAKGVQVLQNSGRPGEGAVINIRGNTAPFPSGDLTSSVPDNQPLFVIDGVPFFRNNRYEYEGITATPSFEYVENPLGTINPNDIESIEILKDAAATAIFGSRGANGVIIVNTKRGKGEMKVNIRATTSVANRIKDYDFLNAKEYKEFTQNTIKDFVELANNHSAYTAAAIERAVGQMANLNTDSSGKLTYEGAKDDYYGDADTDWQKEVYRKNSFAYNIDARVSGSLGKSGAFSLSVGKNQQEGVLKGDLYDKYSFRTFYSDDIIAGLLKMESSVNISKTNNLGSHAGDAYRKLNRRPTVALFDEDGNPQREDEFQSGVKTATLPNVLDEISAERYDTNSLNLLGNFNLNAYLFEGFNTKLEVALSRFTSDSQNFKKKSHQRQPVTGNPPVARLTLREDINNSVTVNWTNSYNFSIDENRFSTMLGISWDRLYQDVKYEQYSGFPDDDDLITKTYAKEIDDKYDQSYTNGLNGIFTRVSYDYGEMLSTSFVLRRDQSSKFGTENQFAYFPSGSIAFNALKSPLVIPDFFSQLKLRVSAGQSGSNNIKSFVYKQYFKSGSQLGRDIYNGQSTVTTGSIYAPQ